MLKVERDREDRGMLASIYLMGGCVAFAAAARKRVDWPAVALYRGDQFVHVGLKSPDGSIFDSRGFRTDSGFSEQFTGEIREIDLAQLIDRYPFSDFIAERADDHLEILFPDFPGEHPRAVRLEAFLAELQALSEAHGLYLRPAYPNAMVLYTAYGDEAGYEAKMSAGGLVVDRLLNAPDCAPKP